MHAARTRRAHDVVRAPPDADGKLLEGCPFWKHQLEPCVDQSLFWVFAEGHARLPQLAQPVRPEPTEVYEPCQRKERLIRRDVRRRLLASDVLLAGLEGEDIAALPRGVQRLPDDPARHAADELAPRGEEPVVGAGERLIVARALSFADRHPAAVLAGRLEHAERHEVDVRDGDRPRVARRGGKVRSRLEAAEENWRVKNGGGGVRRRLTNLLR